MNEDFKMLHDKLDEILDHLKPDRPKPEPASIPAHAMPEVETEPAVVADSEPEKVA
jgi:hypothetical protein